MKFKVGQEVAYIMKNCPEIGLIHGKVYEVLGTNECACSQQIDIGITHDKAFCYCEDCGEITNIDERYFFSSEGFIPVIKISVSEFIAAALPQN
jgi:hypothetical protein